MARGRARRLLGWVGGQAWALLVAVIMAVLDRWRSNPAEALAVGAAVARAFAQTVDSGFVGIVYRFGRVHRVKQPGLVWLIPWVEQLQSWPVQATTMELAPQRVELADGLVFRVVATLVVRLGDPVAAAVEVADCWHGCRVAGALTVREVLGACTRADWNDRASLDARLQQRLGERLAGWGVVVERAGFSRVMPDLPTRRITMIDVATAERRRVFEVLRQGAPLGPALGMLGASRRWVSHAWRTYRGPEEARR